MTAQAGATLAVAVKSKSQKVKALAFPATISALLGITEPAIFGVNLRYVKPFVIALGAGAVGGWIASMLNLAGTGFGITIIPGTLLYLNGQLLKYVLMVVFTTALSFGLTYLFGYEDEASSVLQKTKKLVQLLKKKQLELFQQLFKMKPSSLQSLVKRLL